MSQEKMNSKEYSEWLTKEIEAYDFPTDIKYTKADKFKEKNGWRKANRRKLIDNIEIIVEKAE